MWFRLWIYIVIGVIDVGLVWVLVVVGVWGFHGNCWELFWYYVVV